MRMIIAIAAVVLVAGCIPQTYEYKGQGASGDFESIKQQCIYEAQLHVNYDPIMWPMIVQQCLRAKGWVGVKK